MKDLVAAYVVIRGVGWKPASEATVATMPPRAFNSSQSRPVSSTGARTLTSIIFKV